MNLQAEAARCLKCKNARCSKFCPIATPIPDAMRLYEAGEIGAAGELLFNNNPLSAICAIVCPHERNCFGHCALNGKKAPIGWYEIEQEISGAYLGAYRAPEISPNGKRIAVVGAGPSGITASILLARMGYAVTLMDMRDEIGGVLRYGIPEYRLSNAIVDRYAAILDDLGVVFKPNIFIGSSLTIDDMFIDGYHAVFVAVGTPRPNRIGLIGETLGHVHYAVDYLRTPSKYKPAKRVVVVGAGNVAVDAARTALRHSPEASVTMLNNRRDEDMTGDTKELDAARSEGVTFASLQSTIKLTHDGVLCAAVDAVENGDGGIAYVEDFSRVTLFPADRIIVAIGQGPQGAAIAATNIARTNRGLYDADDMGRTNQRGVFAAGDVVTGPKTVVEAAAFTKRAVEAIDEYCKSL